MEPPNVPHDASPRPRMGLYRLALRLLPPTFRRRWGADMVAVFAHRLERAGPNLGKRLGVWLAALTDIMTQAAAEWVALAMGKGNGTMHGRMGMRDFVRDLRYALRALRAVPGLTLLALLTLGLGIGASTATFSVVNGVLLQDLPYPDSDRLVVVWPEQNFNISMIGMAEEAIPAIEAVTGMSGWRVTLIGEGDPVELAALRVSAKHFEVLGVQPAMGRGFLPEEEFLDDGAVAILSHGAWMRLFGGDPSVIGRTIRISGADQDARTVVGIMPEGFRPVEGDPDVWLTMSHDPSLSFEEDGSFFVNTRIGRLAPGATLEQAQEQLRPFAAATQVRRSNIVRESTVEAASVRSFKQFRGNPVQEALWAALGAVSLVLLIACANVANLLLARGEAQVKAQAVRTALGASRARAFMASFSESALLGVGGGALGVGLSYALVRIAVLNAPPTFPRLDEVAVDGVALFFAVVATVVGILLAGALPSLRASRVDSAAALQQSTRAASGHRNSRLSRALIAGEVALAVIVATGSGLMLRSLDRLISIDPGLSGERVLTMRVIPPESRYSDGAASAQLFEQIMDQLRAVPGVTSAGAIHLLPGTSGNWSFPTFPTGVDVPEGDTPPSVNFRAVWPGYFETTGIDLVSGRLLSDFDRPGAEHVALVNQAFVERFWSGEDALAKEVRLFSATGTPYRVAGVVSDVRQLERGREPMPEVYVTHSQWGWGLGMWLVVRTQGSDPLALADAVKQAAWTVDEEVPISAVAALDAVLNESTATMRFLTLLLGAFGVLAVGLGGIGVFGVTSYAVGRRSAEFGVRIALGATQPVVLRSALRDALVPVVLGLMVGSFAAVWASGAMESMVFGVSTKDPITMVGVVTLLVCVAIAAAALPAWRASHVDPVEALASE